MQGFQSLEIIHSPFPARQLLAASRWEIHNPLNESESVLKFLCFWLPYILFRTCPTKQQHISGTGFCPAFRLTDFSSFLASSKDNILRDAAQSFRRIID